MQKKNHFLRAYYFASTLATKPFIDKSSSGIRFSGDRYTYVLNNPLKYTDPSGYVYRWKVIQWEKALNEATHSGGGGGSPANRNPTWWDVYQDMKQDDPYVTPQDAMNYYDNAISDPDCNHSNNSM